MQREHMTTPEQVIAKIREALEAAAEAGWNSCRRQVYLLSEDYIDRTHPLKATDDTAGNFYRGQYDVAKSFAKAFNAFEARDCDYFKQIDFAALAATATESPLPPSKVREE